MASQTLACRNALDCSAFLVNAKERRHHAKLACYGLRVDKHRAGLRRIDDVAVEVGEAADGMRLQIPREKASSTPRESIVPLICSGVTRKSCSGFFLRGHLVDEKPRKVALGKRGRRWPWGRTARSRNTADGGCRKAACFEKSTSGKVHGSCRGAAYSVTCSMPSERIDTTWSSASE